jgi:hypothetical protein
MSLDQLKLELAEIKHPLLVMRSGEAMQRVFDLYRQIAGREPRGSGRCYACACDAWHELNRISQVGTGWDNSLNLPDWIPVTDLTIIHKMEKYKMTVKSFRPFGSPDTITELNTTDAQVEVLLKSNPDFEMFFVLRDASKANAKVQFEIESKDSKATKELNVEVTEEVLTENPELAEAGVMVGETIQVPKEAIQEKKASKSTSKK